MKKSVDTQVIICGNAISISYQYYLCMKDLGPTYYNDTRAKQTSSDTHTLLVFKDSKNISCHISSLYFFKKQKLGTTSRPSSIRFCSCLCLCLITSSLIDQHYITPPPLSFLQGNETRMVVGSSCQLNFFLGLLSFFAQCIYVIVGLSINTI